MKRLLGIIVALLIAVPTYPWSLVGTIGVPGGEGGGVTYIYQENFEGTGYDSALGDMTVTGATVNPDADNAGMSMEGSQALSLVNNGTACSVVSPTWSAFSPIYGYFICRFPKINTAATALSFFFAMTAEGASQFKIYHSSGKLQIGVSGIDAGGGEYSISADTTYHIWWDYTAATSTGHIYCSTTATKPGTATATVVGTANATVGKIQFASTISGTDDFDVIIDKVRVSNADIGSNPY